VSTWRRKAQEVYPSLSGDLETWDRVSWNSQFSQILFNSVASQDAQALEVAVRYLSWCWSQRQADEQFIYFVEYTLRQLLERPADRFAFAAFADANSFRKVLAMYAEFNDKAEVVELEREHRFRHRPNKSLERTREG
jgi:hypothetical protein